MSRIPPLPSSIGLGQSTLQNNLAQAMALAGLSSDAAFVWQDFDQYTSSGLGFNWMQGAVGSGQVNAVDLTKGGITRLQTGATVGSSITIETRGTNIAGQGTDTWCLATRFKIQTAVTAQTTAAIGVRDWISSSKTIGIGFNGPLNGSNFGVQHSGTVGAGSFLNSGVAVDTAFHTAFIYVRGDSTIRLRFDGAAEVSAALSSPPTSSSEIWAQAQNGTDAVNRNMDIDWILLVSGRTP